MITILLLIGITLEIVIPVLAGIAYGMGSAVISWLACHLFVVIAWFIAVVINLIALSVLVFKRWFVC